jgi:hypothetical protein
MHIKEPFCLFSHRASAWLFGLRRCLDSTRVKGRLKFTTEENQRWLGKLSSSNEKVGYTTFSVLGLVVTTVSLTASHTAWASTSASDNPGALSVESVKTFLDPVGSLLARLIFLVAWLWDYLMVHPALAALIAATVATRMALQSIATTRSVTRLKETFALLERSNWDRDVIKARIVFSRIRDDCKASPQTIAIYAYEYRNPNNLTGDELQKAREEHEEHCGLLRSILNANENMSLGVKRGIIDEAYLYKAMKTNMIRDWKCLSPLVYAYRDRLSSHVAFIEFEGLVSAWEKDVPYGPAKRLSETKKSVQFN